MCKTTEKQPASSVPKLGLPGTEFPNGEIPMPKPTASMDEVRKAIPKELFKKDVKKSLFYMLRDFAIVAALYYFRPNFFDFGILGKVVWWNITGFFGWALFVVGHDCGHGTFSDYKWLNDLCGHICHAPILVPFHGWRISHHKHHLNHNHVDKDHSWKPFTATEYESFLPSTVMTMFRFHLPLLLLYPYYLLKENDLYGFSGNHFNPWSSMFGPNDRIDAAVSSLSVIGVLAFLFYNWSPMVLLECYFIPYFIFVAWLDMVTYLQHTDEKAIYYREGAWTYYLGALSTIDRNYGSVINHFHHNIETHVLHHMFFTKIPHYNLVAATDAVESLIGDYYIKDETFFPKALWNSIQSCHYVPDEGLVVKYEKDPEWKGPKAKA